MKPAVTAFRSFAEWLKTERLPNSDNSYALGREKYMEMLRTEFVNLTPEQILARGLMEPLRFAASEVEKNFQSGMTTSPTLTVANERIMDSELWQRVKDRLAKL